MDKVLQTRVPVGAHDKHIGLVIVYEAYDFADAVPVAKQSPGAIALIL